MNEEEIISLYQNDGYVVLRDLIADLDLDPMRDYLSGKVNEFARELLNQGKVKTLHDSESFERRLAALNEEAAFPPWNISLKCFGREFYDLYNHPKILSVLRQLLGLEVTNHGIPALRTKLPGDLKTTFPWHQDSLYYNEPVRGKWKSKTEHLHVVTVWVPLVNATIENGCLWIIPGSHRWGLLKGARSADNIVRMEDDVESRSEPKPLPMKVGDVLFLTNLTMHTSKLNKTQNSRWSIDFRYHATPKKVSMKQSESDAAQYLIEKARSHKREPLIVITEGHKPGWEEWLKANEQLNN